MAAAVVDELVHPHPGGEDDPEIAAMRRDISRETFGQEVVEALFTEFVGRVFKEFAEEVHVRDFGYTQGRRTFAAVDYGFTSPFVWLLVQLDQFDKHLRAGWAVRAVPHD